EHKKSSASLKLRIRSSSSNMTPRWLSIINFIAPRSSSKSRSKIHSNFWKETGPKLRRALRDAIKE
ncbi:unnamed protein product, partial [Ilex paraguariensis]